MNISEIGPDGAQRLWEYRIQVEDAFYQRNSFFLIAQSMLFVAFATVLGDGGRGLIASWILLAFGITLGVLWLWVNLRQTVAYRHVRDAAARACPEYDHVRATRPNPRVRSWNLLAKWVPVTTLIAWLALGLFVVPLRAG